MPEGPGDRSALPHHYRLGIREVELRGASPSSVSSSQRSALPTDAHVTASLPAAFHDTLGDALQGLHVTLQRPVLDAIEAHARLLTAWDRAINLTAHRTPERMALENVADSLTALPFVAPGCRLIDLGSGSGYPGLPLAVAGMVAEAALVDSIKKKARFLAVAARAASDAMHEAGGRPPALSVIDSRAEHLHSDPIHAGAWDLVTVRAVARLKRVAELALPLLRSDGSFICWKRDDGRGSLARELEEAAATVGRLGGGRPEIHQVALSPLADHRLVVVRRRR